MQELNRYYDRFGTLHVEHQDRMTGDLAFQSIQDISGLIRENREFQNHYDVKANAQRMMPKGVEVKSVWSIPKTAVYDLVNTGMTEDEAINRIIADPRTFADFKVG